MRKKVLLSQMLLRLMGSLFLLFALYWIVRILIESSTVPGKPWTYSWIQVPLGGHLLNLLIYLVPPGGVLLYVGVGVLLVGLSWLRANVAYWSMQLAILLVGVSLWYQQGLSGVQIWWLPDPQYSFSWLWISGALLCCLLLLAFYRSLIRRLTALFSRVRAPIPASAS